MPTAVATVTHTVRCADDGIVTALHQATLGWLCGTCGEATRWLALSDPREWVCEGCMADRDWSAPTPV